MNSVEKAVWILKRLSLPPYSMSLSSLSKELDMGRSGAHKILSSLKEGNLVAQDDSTKQYRLGIAIYRMGNEFSKQLGIWDASENIMKELLAHTKETVSIGVLEGDVPFLAYRLVDSSYAHLALSLGARYPLHASAIGKCLAAFMDQRRVRELLAAEPLEAYTGNTITDVDTLLEEYGRIRQCGYAVSYEEHILGEAAIAAPIRIDSGSVQFSLSVGGVTTTFRRDALDETIQSVKRAAARIAEKMSYKRM